MSSFNGALREHMESVPPRPATQKFFDDPFKMLRSMAIVLKSASANERGVICLRYSYTFPLFSRLFDIERLAKCYRLVLEPSWSGYCNMDILCYSQIVAPVFVQAYEPRDAQFITCLSSNLVSVPLSANWWVDHRIFRPLSNMAKDTDIIMVAGWGDFKRHHRFFRALKKLRERNRVVKVILIGYPMGRTKDDIFQAAEYYGVSDQVEAYEWISQQEVNVLLNRSKVNVIWSRREGVNRAIIEGMFAGVPCILREGFNYGYPYPYINSETGCFSAEEELPDKLLWMIENHHQFAPRDWVIKHMSCQRATEILSEEIKGTALKSGEAWTGDLAVKVNGLHGMSYWDDKDLRRFESDYQFLASTIRDAENRSAPNRAKITFSVSRSPTSETN
jgi:glycosyltransferase involved in cell wall biosynthesis